MRCSPINGLCARCSRDDRKGARHAVSLLHASILKYIYERRRRRRESCDRFCCHRWQLAYTHKGCVLPFFGNINIPIKRFAACTQIQQRDAAGVSRISSYTYIYVYMRLYIIHSHIIKTAHHKLIPTMHKHTDDFDWKGNY